MSVTNPQIGPAPYATADDFRRIFETNTDRLYMLSFMLTANQALAEKCFVQGLQDARNGNPVFRDWAESWSRRTVIMNAIRALRPSPEAPSDPGPADAAPFLADFPQLRSLLALPTFDRFVYVVTVLEGYSDRECALLFGRTREAVVSARVRALRILGDPKNLEQQLDILAAGIPNCPQRSFSRCSSALSQTA